MKFTKTELFTLFVAITDSERNCKQVMDHLNFNVGEPKVKQPLIDLCKDQAKDLADLKERVTTAYQTAL